MKYIYHSSIPGISPQVAAAIHLGILPANRPPAPVEWNRVTYRTGFSPPDQGGIFLLGRTGLDEIYILAYPARTGELVVKSAYSMLELMGTVAGECRLVDCGRVGRAFPMGKKCSENVIRVVYPLLAQLVKETRGGVQP